MCVQQSVMGGVVTNIVDSLHCTAHVHVRSVMVGNDTVVDDTPAGHKTDDIT